MDGLTEGRIVHYVLPDGQSASQHRPAIIVKVWSSTGPVNLQVFTDSMNDGENYKSGQVWKTSVVYSEVPAPGTWHWIERA